MRGFLFLCARILGSFLILAVAAFLACIVIGVTIDLSFLKPGVEVSAKAALGREVKINGPVVFEFSTWPAIQVNDVTVANLPNASDPFFFHAGQAALQIALLPLLKRDIQIGEISARDVVLNLESDAEGRPNWHLGNPESGKSRTEDNGGQSAPPESAHKPEQAKGTGKTSVGFIGLDRLSLENIRLTYRDAALGKTLKFHLEEMTGKAAPGEPMSLDFKGSFQEYDYAVELSGSSIEELIARNKPWAFTMDGEIAGKKISARGDLMERDEQPQVNLAFGIRDVNVGAILSFMGIVEGMEAYVGDAGFEISASGNNLKQILEQSSMLFSVRDARWRVAIPETQALIDITDLSGDIRVERASAVSMDLNGRIRNTPVKLLITGAPLISYVTNPNEIPLNIHAVLADTHVDFSTRVALPISSRNLELTLQVSGNRLNDLDDLLRLDLPPIGPVMVDTRLKIAEDIYDIYRLNIEVGESRLTGSMKLETSGATPRLDVKLVSDLIQIDDFSALRQKETGNQSTVGTHSEQKNTGKNEAPGSFSVSHRDLLSREVLSLLDANIKVEARQVMSGRDRLGSGFIEMSLKNSRLSVNPLVINVPGGGIRISGDYLPTSTDVSVNLKADIDKFDIGIMFRRLKPGTDMGGIFFLDAELNSTAPDLEHMMEFAQGHLGFMLKPENFSAGIIDLWTVNLLSAIMRKASEKDNSRINCMVVRMEMQDGVMKEKAIYMDTSSMYITGKADIDFKTHRLNILLVPKAKKPQFFSLAVPIQVQGRFDDFGLKVGIGGIVKTGISFITSPVHVPIQRIFSRKIPEDGRAACMEAWSATDDNVQKETKPESKDRGIR